MRQEGLIGKIRSERSEPVTLSWDKDEEPVKQYVKPASPVEATIPHPQIESEHFGETSDKELVIGMFSIYIEMNTI